MPIAFAALALAVVAFVLWLSGLSKTKGLTARVDSLLVENSSLQEQVKHAIADQKKAQKSLEQRNEELVEIRKEIGAIKKKNFALQEDVKKTKSSFEAKLEEREKQLVARPAFEDVEPEETKSKKKAKSDSRGASADGREPSAESREPNADGRVPSAESRAANPDGREPNAESRGPIADAASADAELTRRVESLGAENAELKSRLDRLENDLRESNAEQRRAKKKVDDYRRAEMVIKSRMELLNDKLGSMGRQYYDAISELAALKGEKAPPAPQPPTEKTPDVPATEEPEPAAAATKEDDVHALSRELVGVLKQRDSAN